MRKAIYDLGYLEDLFGDERFHGWPAHREQTAWGFLGARGSARRLDPRQFPMVLPRARYSKDWIGAHVFSPGRSRLVELADRADQAGAGPAVRVRTKPGAILTPAAYKRFKLTSAVRRRYLG